MINKSLIIYSFIGGILLLLSRLSGKYLYYLSGYLYLLSYISLIIISLVIAKKKGVRGWSAFKLGISVFTGMTLIYIVFVFLINI
jgi:hypothetical protein